MGSEGKTVAKIAKSSNCEKHRVPFAAKGLLLQAQFGTGNHSRKTGL